MKRFMFLSLVMLVSFFSCKKDDDKQGRIDRQKILDYINTNSLDAQETASGLFYVIEEPGNGEHPGNDAIITIHYKGYLLNGHVFDSTEGLANPRTFPLTNLIDGWKQGIPLFGKGGKGKLLLPSKLGYGSRAYFDIPANSVLIFNVHLIDFE